MRIPVRKRSSDYEVVLDPNLDLRGRTRGTAEDIYMPGRITLRQWDAEVFLHECLHALIHEGRWAYTAPSGESFMKSDSEEDLVRHLAHGLYEMGWRLTRNSPDDLEQP